MFESSQSKCQFVGELPVFGEKTKCDHCRKLRSAGEVLRCQIRGPRIEGLGDVIATVTHATGIAQAVEFITGGDCGCLQRQDALNAALPLGSDPPVDGSSHTSGIV